MQTSSSQFQQKLQALEQQSKQIFYNDDSVITKENRYQNLFTEICLEEYILISNITNLENEVLPNLANKIQAIEMEIQTLDQKKMKLDSMISGFKKLSNELDTKMEAFLKESKDAQKLQHQNRDQLTQSFSLRVDEITLRLRTLETRKTTLATQYNTLQNDLRTCMDDFQHYDKLFHNLMSTPLSPSIMKLLNHNPKNNHHIHHQDNNNNNNNTSTSKAAVALNTNSTDKRNKKAIKQTSYGDVDIKPLSTEIGTATPTASSSSSSSFSSTAHMTSEQYNNNNSGNTGAGDDGDVETFTAVGHDDNLGGINKKEIDEKKQTEITEELNNDGVANCEDKKHEDEDNEVDNNNNDDEDSNDSEDDKVDNDKGDENEEEEEEDEEDDEDEMSEAQNQQYEISHMIYHDFLSHMLPLEQLESTYQMELNQFVDRFGELNYGLTSSNSSLSEHEKRVRELEGTLASLEQQQVKGKQILQEIKRVIDNETKTCQSMQESIESVKSKANKYQLMSQAFEQDIAVLQREIKLYEGVQ